MDGDMRDVDNVNKPWLRENPSSAAVWSAHQRVLAYSANSVYSPRYNQLEDASMPAGHVTRLKSLGTGKKVSRETVIGEP